MIKPTVGRVVLVFNVHGLPSEPVPALICKVWGDRMVNVGGFDANGLPFAWTSVQLVQEEDPVPSGLHAVWMPYQKEQAKKADPGVYFPVAELSVNRG